MSRAGSDTPRPGTLNTEAKSFQNKPANFFYTDAHGKNVYRKLMAAGESASASGALPLSVTVGNAEATSVQVRGQGYDLAPVTHGHVARFQVK